MMNLLVVFTSYSALFSVLSDASSCTIHSFMNMILSCDAPVTETLMALKYAVTCLSPVHGCSRILGVLMFNLNSFLLLQEYYCVTSKLLSMQVEYNGLGT